MVLENNSSLLELSQKPLTSLEILSENGLIKEKLSILELLEDKESMPLTDSLQILQPLHLPQQIQTLDLKFVTAESLPKDKKRISKDKFSLCNQNSQIIKSSQILDQESTLNESPLEPFWSFPAKDLSKKLWLPTVTDSVDSLSNSLNGSFNSIKSNSWFSIKQWTPNHVQTKNLLKTSLPSSTFSIAELMEKENIQIKNSKKPPPTKVRKFRLHPSKEVAKALKEWFGSVRLTYNWALSCLKTKPREYFYDITWLRKRFVNKVNIPKKYNFLLNTPKHVRDSAIKDLVEGFYTNMKKKRNDSSHKFEMKFRKKKESQAFTIPKEALKIVKQGELKCYPTYLQNVLRFHTRFYKQLDHFDYDCKMIIDKQGRFYLMVPQYEKACENQTSFEKWGSLDPGVRTFQTLYSPKPGLALKFGDKDIARIFRLCIFYDKMISQRQGRDSAFRKGMKRIRLRIKHLIDEVHWKIIRFILNNFTDIIIPPFQTSQMVKKQNRKIQSKTVRKMLCWKHYEFRQRLIEKCKNAGVRIYVRGEEYTTKTCTQCLKINHKVKCEKILKCPHCGVTIDRDLGGARNIFLKNIKAL